MGGDGKEEVKEWKGRKGERSGKKVEE